jgi:hypothetical protein
VSSRCDEVKENVDTIVPKTGVTLDTGFFGENVIILSLEIANNLGEAASISRCDSRKTAVNVPCFVIDLVAKAGSVDNGEGNSRALFVEFCGCN